ncbi:MAG: FKBP-type peptidyl-prolyl cis-trans isomerase [Bacteroidia bacterium]
MKNLKIAVAALAMTAALNVNAQTMELKTQADSVSYAIGVSVGTNLKTAGLEGVNTELVAKAMAASLKGEAMVMDAAKANQIINDYMAVAQAKKGDASKAKGAAFLEENKKKKGVTILPDGLQYEVIKTGTGPKPIATDKVKVHYTGTLIDGTVFDSSVQRGQPAEFGCGQVIKGWTEALQLMAVGSKWKIYLPYDLAYGDKGAGGQIGPYETLIFEVELLDIVKETK